MSASEPFNSDRARVMGGIRRALGVTGEDAARQKAVSERLTQHASNLIPARAREAKPQLMQRFQEMLEGQSASVFEVASLDEIPSLVAGYLRGKNLPLQVRRGSDGLLASIPWTKEPSLQLEGGRALGSDETGLSHATAGIAETGTLVLTAGPDNPTTLNYLPSTHIVVIEESAVVGAIDDVWQRLRARYGEALMPRVVNFISGPSRTADIEQVLIMGAHGPIRLVVIIVKGA